MHNQNDKHRAEVVKAMDILARCINDEEIMISWLECGVADGDITSETSIEEIVENQNYYLGDEQFEELMTLFLKLMYKASRDGLFCDGIVSGHKVVKWGFTNGERQG